MAKRRTKSPKELKAQKERGRNFNVAEITFIKANEQMPTEKLAEALNASVAEITFLRKQYEATPAVKMTNKMVFIKENASNMTVKQLADSLETTEAEVEGLIKGYNDANGSMIKQSFLVGQGRKRGVTIATEAASQLSDTNNGMTGATPQGFIKPLKELPFIFKTRPDAQ